MNEHSNEKSDFELKDQTSGGDNKRITKRAGRYTVRANMIIDLVAHKLRGLEREE